MTTDPVRSEIEPAVALIPAGAFLMGSEDEKTNERPAHRVWVEEFALAVYPVTNRDYSRFLNATARNAPPVWNDPKFNHPDQPVVAVSWFDACRYCEWIGRLSGKVYRLPTEAEREKAARGRLETKRYPWGDELPDWMDPNGRGTTLEKPDMVGQDPPNGYGLHNMGDLVHEWCSDWYDPDYYRVSPDRSPQGPPSGLRRASRGGAWRHRIKVARCAARSAIPPDRKFTDYGFRMAISH